MESVGLRALRQDASELVRRVEAGEEITITVSGRPMARLVPPPPPPPPPPRAWSDIADLFAGPADPEWARDREALDADVRDPWQEG